MFWGLIMEPQRRYTQQVKKAFHISSAALDITSSGDEPAQVMCTYDGRNYLLCTLRQPDILHCALDLNFDVGTEVSFAASGNSHIHLTGYLVEDPDDFGGEEDDEEEVEEQVVGRMKRTKQQVQNGPPNKKIKNLINALAEEEESEDDSDFDVEKALEAVGEEEDSTIAEEDDDDDDDEEEEDAEDEEDDEDEEDGEESEEESAEEEEQPQKKQVKMNGVAKKQQKSESTNKQQKVELTKKQKKQQQQQQQQSAPKKKTLQGGVIIEEIKEGQGNPAKNGRFVNVYYEGRLKQNNKLFDSTNKGPGFSFRLGSGEVIKAWDVGVAGMKIGGKRRIICPPAMAYGQKGSPPAIPPNSTLVFEVELRKIS